MGEERNSDKRIKEPPATEHQTTLIRQLIDDLWNTRNVDIVNDLFAENFVHHDPTHLDEIHGPDGEKEYVKRWMATFPADTHFTLDDLISVGDTVAFRWTGHGTYDGEYRGFTLKPTTVPVASGIGMARIEDGKIAEMWSNYDTIDIMQHLGTGEPSTEYRPLFQ